MSKSTGASLRLAARKHLQALFGNTILAVMVCAGLALLLGAMSVGAVQYLRQEPSATLSAETPPPSDRTTEPPAVSQASSPDKPDTPPQAVAIEAPPSSPETAEPSASNSKPKASVTVRTNQQKTHIKGLVQLNPDKPPLDFHTTIPLSLPDLQTGTASLQLGIGLPLEITVEGR